MATATSGEQQITIEGQKYLIRTQVVYQDGLGTGGTLSTTSPIRYVAQYKPGPTLSNPIPDWINLGERDVNSKNNWTFTNSAGSGFRLKLAENSPTSLTNSLDRATSNALSKSSGVTVQQATNILQTAPNAAPTIVDPDQDPAIPPPSSGSSSSESVDGGAANITPRALDNPEIVSDYQNTNFGSSDNLRYPLDIKLSDQDHIQFSMETNEGRNLNPLSSNEIFKGLGDRNKGTVIQGTVTLPIQSGITDSNGVEWGGANLDAKDAYLASLAYGGITSNQGLGDTAGSLIGRVLNDMKNAAGDPSKNFGKAINLYLAQEAVGIQGLLSRASGSILNPNLELLFNGPTLRPFTFTFRLSPRSNREAENVRRIIRFFKEGMSVKTASSGVFLKSPNLFNIKYISAGEQHKSLPQIKKCALLGCDVDYTPDGTYMTFNDEAKTMTSYQLSLRFSEVEPIYSNDYKSLPLDQIGY